MLFHLSYGKALSATFFLAKADTGVNEHHEQVAQNQADDAHAGVEQNDALHHRVVVALDTGDQQAAHARDAVEALDIDRADHSVQEGGGNILHQRHHCVAEDVAQGDVVFTHALGTGKADIVLVALVHHVPAQPHGVERHVAQTHGADGQHPVFPVGGVEEQAHVQRGGAVHLDVQIIHCRRHSLDEDDDGRADLIGPAALETAHEQAHRDADDKAQQHGVHAHLDGNGQLLGEDAGDGSVDLIDVAHAEVAVEHIDPEAADLHRQRVQQTHGL